jgi:transcriptional regulator with XRE-family HTH domain
MEKSLNVKKAQAAMEAQGLSQAALAKQLDVSREAVSQWLSNRVFPRPNKLLQLAKSLNLSFADLVVTDEPDAPVVAFRRMKGTKTTEAHIQKAQEMGRYLKSLVPYLPFNTLEVPPVLKAPVNDAAYIQRVASQVRKDLSVSEEEVVDFKHLIHRFSELQAVLVPVMWGSKQRHENAVHIYLPDSGTSWVYLNLDVNVHDFKFWMAHELGHCLSPSLRGLEAEDFADAFAGALLFSEYKARHAHAVVARKKSKTAQILSLIEIAESETISPYTIYLQINQFAENNKVQKFNLEPELHAHISKLNKKYVNLSDALFADRQGIDARDFIQTCVAQFETPFFSVLSQFLKENQKGVGFVQMVTDLPLLDARGIYDELR